MAVAVAVAVLHIRIAPQKAGDVVVQTGDAFVCKIIMYVDME